MKELLEVLRRSPVIAAVRGQEALDAALASPVRIVFLLGGDPFTLPALTRRAREAGRPVFVHMDLVEGVGRDAAGVRWIARMVKPEGILSTRARSCAPRRAKASARCCGCSWWILPRWKAASA